MLRIFVVCTAALGRPKALQYFLPLEELLEVPQLPSP